ncbi:MAG: hypothetical protein ACRDJW_06420 [Thermomicrobiales bacterium]
MEPEQDEYPGQVIEAVRASEVLSIFFLRIDRSLIIDMRRHGNGGPAILLDGMVATPEERLASFDRLRPGFPIPERLTLAPWAGAVHVFAETGILDAVIDRCRFEGGEGLAEAARTLYQELLRLERRALRDLVRGVGMRSMWEREPGT